jgi:hypothetical protein
MAIYVCLALLNVINESQHLWPIIVVYLVRNWWNIQCPNESWQYFWIGLEADSFVVMHGKTWFRWRQWFIHEEGTEQSDADHSQKAQDDYVAQSAHFDTVWSPMCPWFLKVINHSQMKYFDPRRFVLCYLQSKRNKLQLVGERVKVIRGNGSNTIRLHLRRRCQCKGIYKIRDRART